LILLPVRPLRYTDLVGFAPKPLHGEVALMSTTSVQSREIPVEAAPQQRAVPSVVAWTSFVFALLQSLCTFFGAANGLRLLIGLGSLALSSGAAAFVDTFHSDWFRRPMNGLALAGAILNLIVLWQIRRLRARPAAQWRVAHPSPKKLRSERWQFWLSIATLVLVVIEESLHYHWHHGRL
jgi:hypothetical protein